MRTNSERFLNMPMKFSLRGFVGGGMLLATAITAFLSVDILRPYETFTIQFARGDNLADGAEANLQKAATTLTVHPELRARVIGHVRPGADVAADQALSLSRARQVASFLADHGVVPARQDVAGHGGTEPPVRPTGESDSEWGTRAARVEITTTR